MHKNRFTRIGFILAAAGSAVGLGNIWKFPYITGNNGGGVFVLVYLATVFFIGMSIFIGEVLLGSSTNKNAVTTFETLAPKEKKYWKYTGFTFLTGLLILTFYCVVIGWIFNYIVMSVTALPTSLKESEEIFMSFLKEDIYTQFIYYTITFAIVAYTISKGVKKGIERFNNILMPALIGIFLALLFFIALAFAAITSAVSILEPTVMYLVEKKNMSRQKATYGIAFFAYIVGIFVLLSNSSSFSESLTFGSKNLFDWFDFISSAILLPLGGIIIAIFIGYIMDKEVSKKAIVPHTGETFYKIWLFTIRYLAPFAVFVLMLKESGIITLN